MTPFDAAILGIVEGLTEFLPVSSTGHLIVASQLLGLGQTEFQKTFEISIQLGAIAAVAVLYWRAFLRWEVLKRVIAGFLPTGVIGLALYKVVKLYLLGNTTVVVIALALGGALLIAFEKWHAVAHGSASGAPVAAVADTEDADIVALSYKQVLIIGVVQSLAVVPGVSRSAATIVGGMAQGLKRETVVRFSFLLAVPTMLAATGLDLLKNASAFAASDFLALGVGLAVSFAVAMAAIAYLLRYVRTRTFVPFGIYRIVAAAVFWLLVR